MLGNGTGGSARYPCYGKLEAAVTDKSKNAIKKMSDKCGEKKGGPLIAAVATDTGIGEDMVCTILLALRSELKRGETCAGLLATATAAAQVGEGDGTGPTATAADQPTASLDTSGQSSLGQDATEGAAGGKAVGAGESVSPTTTAAGRAGVGTDGYRKGTADAATFSALEELLPGALKSIKPDAWHKIFQNYNWDNDSLPVYRKDGDPDVGDRCREQAEIRNTEMVALLNEMVVAEGHTPRDHVFLRRLVGCLEQHIHRDAKHGLAVILALTDGYTVRLYPRSHKGGEARMDAQMQREETDDIAGDGQLITLKVGEYIVFDARLVHAGGASTRAAAIEGTQHTDLAIHFYMADDKHEVEKTGGDEPSYPVFKLSAAASGGARAAVVPAAVAGGASIGGDEIPLLVCRDGKYFDERSGALFDGQGTVTRGDEKWTGEFKRGDIVNGTHTKPGRTYTGEFNARFRYHGKGVRETPGQSTVRLEGNWKNGFAVDLMHRTLPNGNTIKQCYFAFKTHNRRKPFDPILQDHHGKYAWYAGLPGNEHGKLTALEDGQYTFACQNSQRTVILQEYEASEAVEAQKERNARPSGPRIVDAAPEESPTGPAHRKRSEVADAAADDEPAPADDESSNGEDVQPAKQKRKSMQTKAATKAVPRKKRKKSDPYSREELLDQLDHLEKKGPAFTLTHASNSDVPGATAGKVIDSVEYNLVMDMSSFAADKKRKWAAMVNKKARAGYLPVHGHEKSTGGLRRCMHDMAVNGAKRLGVTIDGKQFMKECKPRRTVDTSFAEIETAPSIASKVTFTHVNVSHQKGGNEAALLSIEDGGVYAVMAQVDGRTAEYHAFVYDSTGILPGPYKAHSGIVIDNGKKRPVFLIDKEDRSSVQKKRDVLNDLFGARTYVMHVYRMQAVKGE